MKRAQEEMVGFALLIIIVAVIGVVFFGIYVRNSKSSEFNSLSVQQFTDSLFQTTSLCSPDSNSFISIGEALESCYNNPLLQCGSKQVCEYLNETIYDIISKAWNIASESSFNSFEFTAFFKNRVSKEETQFLSYTSSCLGNSLSGESIIPDSNRQGNIHLRITICESNS